MIPQILQEIVDYLKAYELTLVSGSDPRRDSANSEQKIISALQNANHDKWKVITPNVKNNISWYDFICIDNKTKKEYYCDVKVSNCEGNDNMNAKKAIYWLLTGDKNTQKAPDHNEPFFRQLKEKENLSDRDFYYLVVNKKEKNDKFMVSLRDINSAAIVGNPSNPPFQANWSKCKASNPRSMQEAKDFFLGKWADVINNKIKILKGGLPQYYPEYFKR